MWEEFCIGYDPESNQYNFQTKHGTYLAAKPDDEVVANSHYANEWEHFTLERAGDLEGKDESDDWYFLKTYHGGKYLQANSNGSIDGSGSAPGRRQGFKLVEKPVEK